MAEQEESRALLDRAFEEQNVQDALMHLMEKKNSTDSTGLELYKLPEFWRINADFYREICRNGQYMPEPVTFFDIPKKSGAPRRIARYAHVDMLIARMLHQILEPEIRPLLEESCRAYVPGRSIADAVGRAAQWASDGALFCAKLDIADFFDNIHLRRLSEELHLILPEPRLLKVLSALLLARRKGDTEPPERGVLQGGPLSPLMSNIYLRRFDRQWRTRQYLRYADDVFCFTHSREGAEEWLAQARECLKRDYLLDAAEEKCGVFEVEGVEMLGYRLRRYYGKWKAEPLKGGEPAFTGDWSTRPLAPLDRSAWLTQAGELAVEDANFYFMDEDREKRYYPLETLDTIHVLNRVRLSSGFFQYADSRRIRVCFYDRFGNYVGDFLPAGSQSNAQLVVRQALICADESKRLKYAVPLLQACTHNMRFVLRHYQKTVPEIRRLLESLVKCQDEMAGAGSTGALMLIEARAWQTYYAAFPRIMPGAGFRFENRNRRPPRDAVNALLSFGNVVLYNRIATEIHKERLEISLSFLHAAESGRNSLSLDIAEVYKPLIVDRAIFALVNRKELRAEEHFTDTPEGGVYLNPTGKRIFLKELNERLFTYMTVGGKSKTWQNCIRDDVAALKKAILTDGDFRPHRH